jgi:hypothetical protein
VAATPRVKKPDKSDLLRTLAFFTTPDAVEPLLEIVQTEDPGWLFAIESLGHIGDSRAVAPLIAIIKGRPMPPGAGQLAEENAKTAAIEALGLLGDACAVEPLMALMRKRRQAERDCRDIVIALGRIGDRRACEPVADYVFASGDHIAYNVQRGGGWDGKWYVDYPWRPNREALARLFGEDHAAIMVDLVGRKWLQSNADEEAAWDRLSEDQQLCHPCPTPHFLYEYERNLAALQLLCEEKTPVSSNLLRRVAAHGVTLELKEMARGELARRGNPAEDPGAW